MRVISGTLKGKRLESFSSPKIRPTSDRVKESLFNILGSALIEGAEVLDLFSGTGNLGIESLSRGAKLACFAENDRESLKTLRANLSSCGLTDKADIITLDVLKALQLLEKRGRSFDVIFLDPPYMKGLAGRTLEVLGESSIAGDALVVAEHAAKEEMQDCYGILNMMDRRPYGDTLISFYGRGK
ncbi:MAG: 16S rRNA (guanine(966)-N(2))-methyltransferase RsmD [Proteobacteria bacterium]|nr:16S rRNA (guanine(966)-N(2))-methyltransferase RsmD [Pseudomonadota bacterium]